MSTNSGKRTSMHYRNITLLTYILNFTLREDKCVQSVGQGLYMLFSRVNNTLRSRNAPKCLINYCIL